MNYFEGAYKVLKGVYLEDAYLSQELKSLECDNLSLAVKIIYGVLDKDILLDYYIRNLADKKPKNSVAIIIKMGMYALEFLSVKPHAVINGCVDLCKRVGKGQLSGFVNAILRKFNLSSLPLPEDKMDYLSVKYSFKKEIVEMIVDDYGLSEAEKILSYDIPSNYVRVKEGIDGEEYLSSLGVEYKTTPFKNLYNVKGSVSEKEYKKGNLTSQTIGSVAICEVIPPCEKLLDCCAAPGGKSVNLSAKCGSIVATELHLHRAELIKKYCERMNAYNVQVITQDMTKMREEFVGVFDSVLLDAPCSGYGTTLSNPDIKLRRTKSDVLSLKKLQLDLLRNVKNYVKVGGQLYYSTCSILNAENIDNVREFLKDDSSFVLEEITSPLGCKNIDKCLQFLPHLSLGDGFFVCKLKRIK